MGEVITLVKLKKRISPYDSTLVGGVFDLFHVGHLRYLKQCSELKRPLIVAVQSDRTVRIRKGFNRPIINQARRAEIVAALGFVDFVLILDKPSHHHHYLKTIKPEYYVFSKETMKHRTNRARLIKEEFPYTKIVFLNKDVRQSSTSFIAKKILAQRDYDKIEDPIIRRLYYLADHSKASIGKISALLKYQEKIVAESDNIESLDIHAEEIIMKKAKSMNVPLNKTELYILIPPCILCAQKILENNIKKVYYLHEYGNDDGMQFLRKNNIKVEKINSKK